jgi:hypothetical protein
MVGERSERRWRGCQDHPLSARCASEPAETLGRRHAACYTGSMYRRSGHLVPDWSGARARQWRVLFKQGSDVAHADHGDEWRP